MVNRILLFLATSMLTATGLPAQSERPSIDTFEWIDASQLTILGKGWEETAELYDRLPARAEKIVREEVWNLSRQSSGIRILFKTDARAIAARWTVRSERMALPHMPATGVSGLDLYVQVGTAWKWLGAGRPGEFPTSEALLAWDLEPGTRQYLLYLPLYNGTRNVQIGVPSGSSIERISSDSPATLLFYGTSITHGGCASRPGMSYPAIIARRLDLDFINLGFSGNGKTEPEMASLLAELDPAIYILDSLPNLSPSEVKERIGPFVEIIRQKHPETPVVLVESIAYADAFLVQHRRERYQASNAILRNFYEAAVGAGDRNLYYVKADELIGTDGDGTVDGTHPTDLGFLRMADALVPIIQSILAEDKR